MTHQASLLKSIASYIEASAPEIATRQTRRSYYEGEERFTVIYEHLDFDCLRRMGLYDSSDLDPNNGTGYNSEVVYDEIVVLQAWNNITGDEVNDVADLVNEYLIN